jgi:hypothetical protein
VKSLGYNITIYGGNSLHAFECDKCNKIVYNVSEKVTVCKCEENLDGTHGTQIESIRTETNGNAEGSIGSSRGTTAGHDCPNEITSNGNSRS